MSLPEIDGAIEPLIFSGRDGTSGRSIPMQVLIGCRETADVKIPSFFLSEPDGTI